MGVSPPLPEPISLVFPSLQPQNGLPSTAPGGLPSACRPLNLRRDLSVARPPHGERRSGWNPSLPARDPGSLVAVCCGYPPGPPPPIPARPLPPQPRASSTYTRSLMLLPLHAHHPCRHRQRRPPTHKVGVLILGAGETHVRRSSVYQAHQPTSTSSTLNTVSPISTRSPSSRSICPSISTPLRMVPLVLPRSRRTNPPSPLSIEACCDDTKVSERSTSASAPRPKITLPFLGPRTTCPSARQGLDTAFNCQTT